MDIELNNKAKKMLENIKCESIAYNGNNKNVYLPYKGTCISISFKNKKEIRDLINSLTELLAGINE